MNKKILIYGGTSLISLELIKIYNNEEYEFIIFCRDKNNFIERLNKLDLTVNKFRIYEVDLIELEKNLKIISEIENELDGVIWVAGETGDAIIEFQNTNEAKKSIDVNIVGTSNVLDIIKGVNSIKSAVIVTTDKCYKIKKKN